MVKRRQWLWLLALPLAVNAMTADELRRIAGDAERAKRERDYRIKATDLTSLLPSLQTQKMTPMVDDLPVASPSLNDRQEVTPFRAVSVTPVSMPRAPASDGLSVVPVAAQPSRSTSSSMPPAPRARKYGSSSQVTSLSSPSDGIQKDRAPNGKQVVTPVVPTPAYVYVPPARYTPASGAGGASNSDVVAVKQRRFGIRIGAWFSASMSRETTNSDPGLIEIRITEDVEGDYRVLPTGTLLFADKRYNAGTKRLDLKIVRGILPDGEEIELNGLIYDASRVAGLHGIVVENDASTMASGFKSGLIDAGRSVVSTVAGGSPAGLVIDSTVGAVSEAKQAAVVAKSTLPYTIHVSPQPVLIQVQSTF